MVVKGQVSRSEQNLGENIRKKKKKKIDHKKIKIKINQNSAIIFFLLVW